MYLDAVSSNPPDLRQKSGGELAPGWHNANKNSEVTAVRRGARAQLSGMTPTTLSGRQSWSTAREIKADGAVAGSQTPIRVGKAANLTTEEQKTLSVLCAILAKATIMTASKSPLAAGGRDTDCDSPQLTAIDHKIIAFLRRHGESAPSKLAEAVKLTRTSLWKAFGRLEATGQVEFSGTTRNRIVRLSVIATRAAA